MQVSKLLPTLMEYHLFYNSIPGITFVLCLGWEVVRWIVPAVLSKNQLFGGVQSSSGDELQKKWCIPPRWRASSVRGLA